MTTNFIQLLKEVLVGRKFVNFASKLNKEQDICTITNVQKDRS